MENMTLERNENCCQTGECGVSIILPTYNRAQTVGKSIESVLEQSYREFELLVIDDGSEDHTEEIVRSYQRDERIIYYRLKQNQGQSMARNYGMQRARYDYFAFEDSDDIWYPDKLKLQMQALTEASGRAGFVYHRMKYDIPGYGMVVLPAMLTQRVEGNIYAQLLWDNLIGMPTLLVRRSCVEEIGLLDESLECLEDYDWVLRLAKRYEAVFVDKVLLDASYSSNSVSLKSHKYVLASCMLIQKYKMDYLETDTLNHRLECILRDADRLGIRDQVIQILEKIMQL